MSEINPLPGGPGPYSIGSTVWPGISKLIEECGEVQQVAGKLLGTGGNANHWDGTNLRDRLIEEMADTIAALSFVEMANFTVAERVRLYERVEIKRRLFDDWHDEGIEASKTLIGGSDV